MGSEMCIRDSADTKVEDDEEDRQKKKAEIQTEVDKKLKETQEEELKVMTAVRQRQEALTSPQSSQSSQSFGMRKRVLTKLRRHGVSFGHGAFTNRFGQTISPDAAFSYYANY